MPAILANGGPLGISTKVDVKAKVATILTLFKLHIHIPIIPSKLFPHGICPHDVLVQDIRQWAQVSMVYVLCPSMLTSN